jgi:hypothetical protein
MYQQEGFIHMRKGMVQLLQTQDLMLKDFQVLQAVNIHMLKEDRHRQQK